MPLAGCCSAKHTRLWLSSDKLLNVIIAHTGSSLRTSQQMQSIFMCEITAMLMRHGD
jgi:hypothetical protein